MCNQNILPIIRLRAIQKNKAEAGTLTYSDVAKYNAGIRTEHEFNRNNNSDKKKYGTYQAYLKAMYEKYKK